jgi:hypothetical protein
MFPITVARAAIDDWAQLIEELGRANPLEEVIRVRAMTDIAALDTERLLQLAACLERRTTRAPSPKSARSNVTPLPFRAAASAPQPNG